MLYVAKSTTVSVLSSCPSIIVAHFPGFDGEWVLVLRAWCILPSYPGPGRVQSQVRHLAACGCQKRHPRQRHRTSAWNKASISETELERSRGHIRSILSIHAGNQNAH
jgi:hypothetical protein